jgi:hypothetical protein
VIVFLSAVGFFPLHFSCSSCIVQFFSLCGSFSVSFFCLIFYLFVLHRGFFFYLWRGLLDEFFVLTVFSSVSVLFYVVVSISTVVASVLELSFTCCSGGWFFTTEVK